MYYLLASFDVLSKLFLYHKNAQNVKKSGAAEYQKGKYHRSPNITTREIMKVINTRI